MTFIFEYIIPSVSSVLLYILCLISFLVTQFTIPFALLLSLPSSNNKLYILLLNPINSVTGEFIYSIFILPITFLLLSFLYFINRLSVISLRSNNSLLSYISLYILSVFIVYNSESVSI